MFVGCGGFPIKFGVFPIKFGGFALVGGFLVLLASSVCPLCWFCLIVDRFDPL